MTGLSGIVLLGLHFMHHHSCEIATRGITGFMFSKSGSNPIDVTDPKWEIYLVVQKNIDHEGGSQLRLLGFSTVYRFYHYPDSCRLRLSQVPLSFMFFTRHGLMFFKRTSTLI